MAPRAVNLLFFYILCSLCTNGIVGKDPDTQTIQTPKTKGDNDIELPPPIFPDDNAKYRIVPSNETMLKILTENVDVKTRASEIFDLLHSARLVDTSPDGSYDKDHGDASSQDASGKYASFKLQSELLQRDREFVAKDEQKQAKLHEEHTQPYGLMRTVGLVAATLAGLVPVSVIVILVALLLRTMMKSHDGRQVLIYNDSDSVC